jgi:hypothetical protein
MQPSKHPELLDVSSQPPSHFLWSTCRLAEEAYFHQKIKSKSTILHIVYQNLKESIPIFSFIKKGTDLNDWNANKCFYAEKPKPNEIKYLHGNPILWITYKHKKLIISHTILIPKGSQKSSYPNNSTTSNQINCWQNSTAEHKRIENIIKQPWCWKPLKTNFSKELSYVRDFPLKMKVGATAA